MLSSFITLSMKSFLLSFAICIYFPSLEESPIIRISAAHQISNSFFSRSTKILLSVYQTESIDLSFLDFHDQFFHMYLSVHIYFQLHQIQYTSYILYHVLFYSWCIFWSSFIWFIITIIFYISMLKS